MVSTLTRETALHYACKGGHFDIVKILVNDTETIEKSREKE
jgi:ankyrin repeat protein